MADRREGEGRRLHMRLKVSSGKYFNTGVPRGQEVEKRCSNHSTTYTHTQTNKFRYQLLIS